MSRGLRLKRKYKIIFIDVNTYIKELLEEYHRQNFPRIWVDNRLVVVSRRAQGINEVRRKVEAGFIPQQIVFSSTFPSQEVEDLRQWLNERQHQVIFLTVTLPQATLFS